MILSVKLTLFMNIYTQFIALTNAYVIFSFKTFLD